MILPKIGSIYKYKDKEVSVLMQKPLFYVYVLEYAQNSNEGSCFKSFNWFKFAKSAKYVRELNPKNSAY